MNKHANLPTLVELNQSSANRHVFCLHTIGGGVWFYNDLAEKLADHAKFWGLEEPAVFDEFEYRSIPELAEYHLDTIKEVQEEGPYILMGSCSASPVAYEVANQLAMFGDSVEKLIMFGSALGPTLLYQREAPADRYGFLKDYLQVRLNTDLEHLDWQSYETLDIHSVADNLLQEMQKMQVQEVSDDTSWAKLAILALYNMRMASKKYSPEMVDFDIDLFQRNIPQGMEATVLPWCDVDKLTTGNLNIVAPRGPQGVEDITSQPYLDDTVGRLKQTTFF